MENLVLLGTISRPQGHLGEMRMIPVFDDPERLKDLRSDRLWLKLPRRPLFPAKLQGFRIHGGKYLVIRLDVAPDMNSAEALRHAEVHAEPETLWAPAEGEWYAYEVVGFRVLDVSRDLRLVGEAKGLSDGAAHSFLLVDRPRPEGAPARPPMLIPVVPDLIVAVDKEAREIRVNLPEGLEEL
jgi:16S rRNA processing protein RimM